MKSKKTAYLYPASILAFLGDAIFTQYVREYLVTKYDHKVGVLNKMANAIVCAKTQAKYLSVLKNVLTEKENDIVMRARNINTKNIAKNSNLEEYSRATSFEALIGYLHLNDENTRLEEIYNIIREEDKW